MKGFVVTVLFWLSFLTPGWAVLPLSVDAVRNVFGGVDGAFVLRDCASGESVVFNEEAAAAQFGPCSTFKIWNSLIGLEEGLIGKPDEIFWRWDGIKRDFPGWDEDRTWREAFGVSCVPAFQDLARRIGMKRMQVWLDKFNYGNNDQAGRPDSFWLPRAGEPTILITPAQQTELICRLVNGQMPVSDESVALLLDVMKLESAANGTLYGKTGSGLRSSVAGPGSDVEFDMGWLVGFVESDRKKYAFACLVLGDGLSGKDARRITTKIFKASGLL
jgi:beta-lactamase class D